MPKKPNPLKRLLDSWRGLEFDKKAIVITLIIGSLTFLSTFMVPEFRNFFHLPKEPDTSAKTEPQKKETPKEEETPPAGTQIEPTVVPIPNTPLKKPKSNGNMVQNRPSKPSSESTTTSASNRNSNPPVASAPPSENTSASERPPADRADEARSPLERASYTPPYVQQAEAEKHLTHRVDPIFPKVKLSKIPPNVYTRIPEGTVSLRVLIHTDGSFTIEEVRASHPEFYQPAEDAVKQWKFAPFIIDGKPTEVYTWIIFEAQKPDEKPHKYDQEEP
jgi:hypothetical protein